MQNRACRVLALVLKARRARRRMTRLPFLRIASFLFLSRSFFFFIPLAMTTVTLALGYMTLPVQVEASFYHGIGVGGGVASDHGGVSSSWAYGSTLSISYFITDAPHLVSTRSMHLIKAASLASPGDVELLQLLCVALQRDKQKFQPRHGVIHAENSAAPWGLVSAVKDRTDTLVLRIIDGSSLPETQQRLHQPLFTVDPDAWASLPVAILQACQRLVAEQAQDTEARQQLVELVTRTHKIARIYGYDDYWRVTEGICTRFQLDARQFLQNP
ncbi:hypothetical protein BC940DRAFT_362480 [Gongronella butleri]|nr:hypothetical protein BC940DRAFT_362480 [Gongronella butleri]